MTKSCAACSMPLEKSEDLGVEIAPNSFCIHCINPDKTVKSASEIFEGGVQFFQSIMPNLKRDFAEKIVRKNMNQLPYWKANKAPCLNGPEASDDEFQAILKKLS